MRSRFLILSLIVIALLAAGGYFLSNTWWWFLLIISPVLLMGFYHYFQKKHTILRNFPLIGKFRYMFETIRPEIYQYFIESDLDGRPFNRKQRAIVYQRAKKTLQTVPFGTQVDTQRTGYEWIEHSLYPVKFPTSDPRVRVGSRECIQPYEASVFNISAMSFGSLGKHAVLALNGGARQGGFAHNTGEGGISPYHIEHQGDLIWQIGTCYFGCRDQQGNFSREKFRENARRPSVKMVEIKLSQGAKPGHGGVLPAKKNNVEIAAIRDIEPYTEVLSPPYHSAFSNAEEMLSFIRELRELSGGKPVGFKLCIGKPDEFLEICKAMDETGIVPDFVTVDGSDGGTGAAPLEFSDSIGMPLFGALALVHDALTCHGVRDQVRVIASGKIITGFDMIKVMALGADLCNSARGMMFALGCIQALRCNTGNCPTGITTHDPDLEKGLVVEDKLHRVANFHEETVGSMIQILEACGISEFGQLKRSHIKRRVEQDEVSDLEELYPYQDLQAMEKQH